MQRRISEANSVLDQYRAQLKETEYSKHSGSVELNKLKEEQSLLKKTIEDLNKNLKSKEVLIIII